MWTEQQIVNLLERNDGAVERAIVAIYNRQTASEKASHETTIHNNIGFSGADAKLGTYLAKWILSGKHLSGQFLDRARKMAIKYRRQLLSIAKETERTTPVTIVGSPARAYNGRTCGGCENCDGEDLCLRNC